jgi:uncharacterized protein YqjF (DUF2071 family)
VAGHQIDKATSLWEWIARDLDHRPWPPPARPWILDQTWRDLLFAHWATPPAVLRPLIPSQLVLDTYAGDAWIGVVPFRIAHLAPRGVPRRVRLAFPEINVRTYVIADGKPGVWFFSLDAANLLAVVSARLAFHLPYYWSRMSVRQEREWITYASFRRQPGTPVAFVGRFRPIGEVCHSSPGTLEDWLTTRYCLYGADRAGSIFRTEIHHPPWPLQAAEAEIAVNTMTAPHGINLPGPPLLHFARRLEVVAWPQERVRGRRTENGGSVRFEA